MPHQEGPSPPGLTENMAQPPLEFGLWPPELGDGTCCGCKPPTWWNFVSGPRTLKQHSTSKAPRAVWLGQQGLPPGLLPVEACTPQAAQY